MTPANRCVELHQSMNNFTIRKYDKFYSRQLGSYRFTLTFAVRNSRTNYVLPSLYVAQAVAYRCYTDTDIVLSLYFLFCFFTVIVVFCYLMVNKKIPKK